MPTNRSGAVRRWLKEGKANVVQLCPFTIRLNWTAETNKQEIIVGLDTGAVEVGCAAISGKVLYASETKLRTDIHKKMQRRAKYRRNRRTRKLRYRQPRFNNRTKPKGWIPPSLKSKAESTIKVITNLAKILPIEKVKIEVAKFDTQKLQNPEIRGKEYQQGKTGGYDNVRAYVFERDKYTCQICKKKGGILQTHHIIQRKDGGSDRPDNLATVHKDCHEEFHKGLIEHKFRKPKSYAMATQVTVLKNYVVEELKKDFDVEITYGHITKRHRLRLGLDKTHYNDAIAICNPEAIEALEHTFRRVCVTQHRYQATKGIRSEKALPMCKLFGFRQWDKVRLPDKTFGFIKGRRSSGYFNVCDIDGKTISASINQSRLVRCHSRNNLMEVMGNSSPPSRMGSPCPI